LLDLPEWQLLSPWLLRLPRLVANAHDAFSFSS
jgi:hypothetical protein